MIFAGVSYTVALFALLALAGILSTRYRHSDLARRVAIVCLVSAVWAGLMAFSARLGVRRDWIEIAADALRYGGWLFALSIPDSRSFHPWILRSGFAMCAGLVVLAVFGALTQNSSFGRFLDPVGLHNVTGLLLACAGLVLTEQVMRNASANSTSGARLLTVGIGGQFAYDLFLFSQAQLLGSVDFLAWSLRGLVIAALTIPIFLSFSRLPAQTPRIFISRHVVFYTSAFVGVGLYLSVMALGGFVVREHGGNWGNAFQILFFGGAAGVLVSLLVSESPLRRLRVFISKHFYRTKYDHRAAWLQFVQTLSATDEPDARRTAINAVAQLLGSPGGLLVMREHNGSRFVAQAAWPEGLGEYADRTAVSEQDGLPRFLSERQWVVDLQEYAQFPERYGNFELPHWLEPGGPWRIVSPLLVGSRLLGFLVLRTPPAPFTMTYEDRDLLKTAGRHVAAQLAQQQADEKLSESRQFDAYNRFAAFVMHDLKNSVAQLQLLVANAARHRDEPEFFEDAISTISNAVERMTRLIEQLQGRDMVGATREVDLVPIVRTAVQRAQSRRPLVSLQGTLAGAAVRADPERLTTILDHIIRNAQDATPATGTVELLLAADESHARLTVSDSGAGMDAEFLRQRLFRPFDTTKGSKGMGIGAYQVREYVRSLGGDVDVQSTPGVGTQFCIRLELCSKKNPAS
jgi:putative PEP-CTERM system histidine kinase